MVFELIISIIIGSGGMIMDMKNLVYGDKVIRKDEFKKGEIFIFDKYISKLKTIVRMTDGSYHNVKNLKMYN